MNASFEDTELITETLANRRPTAWLMKADKF